MHNNRVVLIFLQSGLMPHRSDVLGDSSQRCTGGFFGIEIENGGLTGVDLLFLYEECCFNFVHDRFIGDNCGLQYDVYVHIA